MSNEYYDQFLTEDDDLIASVLEESLRHYNEIEVHLRTDDEVTVQSQNNIDENVNLPTNVIDLCKSPPKKSLRHYNEVEVHLRTDDEVTVQSQNSVEETVNLPTTVIDLCKSPPKKSETIQSRLSTFFKKPTSVNICAKETENENKELKIESCIEKNLIPTNEGSDVDLQGIFYKEPDAQGFLLSSGPHYVYPSNFPVREYQMDIVKTALFHNTLVSLPTGTGKTFIAAVIMYNFYRWYPMGKIVFMAPTRPLVAQQIEACYSIMGFSRDVTIEMTGNIPPEQRYLAWKKYRVFFLTPQVLANDLSLNKCPAEMFRCVIVDEAHRATKDYAYVQVLRHLHEVNKIIRVVGLSATPGTTVDGVIEVIQNLNISKLEFRTDDSPDITKYMNKKEVECLSVKLSNAILHIRSKFLVIYDKYSRRLKQYHILSGNVTNLAKFQILGAKQKFLASNLAREMPKSLVGCLINDFTVCMSFAYALELLTIYGIKVFYLQSLELLENHKCLSNDADLQQILNDINKELSSQDLTWSHPKLFKMKEIILNYFNNASSESNSKIIIFCQYRLVVVEVFQLLQTFGSMVKPVMFVGQSLKEKGGLPQKKQLEVINRFKCGDFNVLIATSVAEEGLDIGEVDLIICLEANKSPIKFVQRLGRTGRKRSGKCITLLTEGKEQMKYKSSISSSKTLVNKMLKNKTVLSKLAPEGPRLIPKHIKPQLLSIHVKQPIELLPDTKKQVKRKTSTNILQYTTPNNSNNHEINDEKELNVFQNNNEKPKKKMKKQKAVELEKNNVDNREVQSITETNLDLEYNIINDNLNLAETNTINTVENDDNSKENSCFNDEENTFKEWLQSCEQANSVVTNEAFFKLLNLFSDCTVVDASGESEYLKNDTTELKNGFTSKIEFKDLFKSQRINDDCVSGAEFERLHGDCRPFSSNSVQQNDSPRNGTSNEIEDCKVGDTAVERVTEKTPVRALMADSDDLFVNRRVVDDERVNSEMMCAEQKRFERSVGQKSPVVSSDGGGYVTEKTVVPDECLKDFGELFNSQKTECQYVGGVCSGKLRVAADRVSDEQRVVDVRENMTEFDDTFKNQKYEKRTDGCDGETRDYFENSVRPIGGPKSSVVCSGRETTSVESDDGRAVKIDFDDLFSGQRAHGGGEESPRRDVVVERYDDDDDSTDARRERNDDDEDDVSLANANFEDMFASQRADLFIERYNSEIVADGDSDGSTGSVCNGPPPKSPIICSGRWRGGTSRTVDGRPEAGNKDETPSSESRKLLNKTTTVDMDDEQLGEIDFRFDGQNGGGGCVVEECAKKKTAWSENAPKAADDVIVLDDSPTFFSREWPNSKPPLQTEPMADRVCEPGEIVDLSTPDKLDADDDDDADLMLLDYRSGGDDDDDDDDDEQRRTDVAATAAVVPTVDSGPVPYDPGRDLLPFNALKTACNLLKPGFSLKRNTAFRRQPEEDARPCAVDVSPAQGPGSRGPPPRFSQSTPKVAAAQSTVKRPQVNSYAANVHNLLTSSSSDSDVFVGRDDGPAAADRRQRATNKRRRPKPKKKLLFIDDEADVSNCGDTSAAMAAAMSSDSSSSEDKDEEFDSSFIDDDSEKSGPSTSMKKQYLRSVNDQASGRGVFKIPELSTQHYNIDVYSQMVDKTDNSYEEDSFCVNDSSELNTSSNMSVQRMSDERRQRTKKRKRISSPQSTTDSDSPNQFNRKLLHKRGRVKTSLDSS